MDEKEYLHHHRTVGQARQNIGKSEELNKGPYGPKGAGAYTAADNVRRKLGRTGEEAQVGPNKAVQHAGPTRNEQAAAAAKVAHQKSKKNPVKVFNRNQIRYLKQKAATHGGSLSVPIKSKLAASEEMSKGIKHVAAAIGIASALASSPARESTASAMQPPAAQVQQQEVKAPHVEYNSGRMLNTIESVESNHGKYTEHEGVGGTMHHGEHAFGRFGLMPQTIRETIQMHSDLRGKHAKALNLKGDDMRRYMEDNPGLENAVAQKHLQRLEHHFGKDPAKIGYAWLQGVRGTYKALKNKADINSHWHVKKINDAYAKEK
jgi:hypothetical protein